MFFATLGTRMGMPNSSRPSWPPKLLRHSIERALRDDTKFAEAKSLFFSLSFRIRLRVVAQFAVAAQRLRVVAEIVEEVVKRLLAVSRADIRARLFR